MKKKVRDKEKENEQLFLNEKLAKLNSVGLTYANMHNTAKDYDSVKMDNGKKMDSISSMDCDGQMDYARNDSNNETDNVSTQTLPDNIQEKLKAKINTYEKMIDEQSNIIQKLKSDLRKSEEKVDLLEKTNDEILRSVNSSSARRTLFPDTSTPIKQNNYQNFKKITLSPEKRTTTKYSEEICDLPEDYGFDNVSAIASGSTMTYNYISQDLKFSGKSLCIIDILFITFVVAVIKYNYQKHHCNNFCSKQFLLFFSLGLLTYYI